MEYSVFLSEHFFKSNLNSVPCISLWTIQRLFHCLSNVVWHLSVDSNSGTFYFAQLLISRWKLIKDNIFQRTIFKFLKKAKGSCLKWLEILIMYFECNSNFFSYFKSSHAYCFCVDFPGSLQHFEICLKLLTHQKWYSLPRGQDRNEAFSGFLKEAKMLGLA